MIGNPPYGASLSEEQIQYYKQNFQIKTSETAILFIEKGLTLCKENALETYIIPKSFTFASNYASTRDFVEDNLCFIVDCGKAFENVLFEACIISNRKNVKSNFYNSVKFTNDKEFCLVGIVDKKIKTKFGFYPNGITNNEIKIGEKIIEKCISLNDIAKNNRGEMFQKFIQNEGKFKVIGGKEIDRFGIRGIKGYLNDEKILTEKAKISTTAILVQNIVAHVTKPYEHIKIIACIPVKEDYFIADTINQITMIDEDYDKRLVWALLNSKFVNWYAYNFIFAKAIRTMHFDNAVTSRIPIPNISIGNPQPIITLVNQILSAKKENPVADTSALEKEIDKLVYELYGLTEEEIKIIEKN
ncbi:hypothetical protein AGMMS49525_14300 [Bacteroidia bacterium]|nr:hypothetical protein AGMMS49525_14300 [Bacteroidia bacterium]